MRSLDTFPIEPNTRKAVREAKRRLLAEFPVSEVVLFGSVARGEATKLSDVDLLVITTKTLSHEERHQISGLLFQVSMDFDAVLSPLICDREKWEHGVWSLLPIRHEIDRDGVLV